MVTNSSSHSSSANPIAHSVSQPSGMVNVNNESLFDARKIFYIIIRRWPIILISVLLALLGSNFYVRYAKPSYAATLKMLIKDTRMSAGMSEAYVFQDLGLLNSTRNLDNEIEILRSPYLMEEVVRRNKLQYNYATKGRLKSNDLYLESPVTVLEWVAADSSYNKEVSMDIILNTNGKYKLTVNDEIFEGELGLPINLPLGILTLVGSKNISKSLGTNGKEININIKSIVQAASAFSKNLTVSFDKKSNSTVVELKMLDEKPSRAKDILNILIDVYNESEVKDKNRIYENTVNFIDERMGILTSELREVEGNVASFRSKTGAINLVTESNLILSQETGFIERFAEKEGQLQIVRGIKRQLNSEGNQFSIVPSSPSLTNPGLVVLINSFNQLLLEREKQIGINGQKNPNVELIERQLGNLRLSIIENINGIERDIQVTKGTLESEQKAINSKISAIPETQKKLLEIERQQAIKQQLYLYLLQKREEAALSLNVTVANNRIIDPPRFSGQVAPKTKQIKLAALALSIFLPIIFILLSQALNSKVLSELNIIENTSTPILGNIPYSETKDHVAISEKKRSAIGEMFRLLRANLQFVGEGTHNRIIAFSSSVSGEGKSFITLNTGLTLALGGKKVIIIELDMRKPKVVNYLGEGKAVNKGITDFIVNDEVGIDEVINKSNLNANLDYIASGPLPPNPSELLLSDKLEILFKGLKERYDYVLVDTPPLGLVSDALLINKLIDCTIFIVRQGLTEQRQLRIVEDINKNGKMPRVYIVFNGIRYDYGGYGYGSGYGYGYNYGYGNGYGYYSNENSKVSFWKRLFKM